MGVVGDRRPLVRNEHKTHFTVSDPLHIHPLHMYYRQIQADIFSLFPTEELQKTLGNNSRCLSIAIPWNDSLLYGRTDANLTYLSEIEIFYKPKYFFVATGDKISACCTRRFSLIDTMSPVEGPFEA